VLARRPVPLWAWRNGIESRLMVCACVVGNAKTVYAEADFTLCYAFFAVFLGREHTCGSRPWLLTAVEIAVELMRGADRSRDSAREKDRVISDPSRPAPPR